MAGEIAPNIREVLQGVIGKRVTEITQNDPDELCEYVMIMFEDGSFIQFFIGSDDTPSALGYVRPN